MAKREKSEVVDCGPEFIALNGGPILPMTAEQKTAYEKMMLERILAFQKIKTKPSQLN